MAVVIAGVYEVALQIPGTDTTEIKLNVTTHAEVYEEALEMFRRNGDRQITRDDIEIETVAGILCEDTLTDPRFKVDPRCYARNRQRLHEQHTWQIDNTPVKEVIVSAADNYSILDCVKELVDNSLQACERQNVAPLIEIELTDTYFSIRDNGDGMDVSHLSKFAISGTQIPDFVDADESATMVRRNRSRYGVGAKNAAVNLSGEGGFQVFAKRKDSKVECVLEMQVAKSELRKAGRLWTQLIVDRPAEVQDVTKHYTHIVFPHLSMAAKATNAEHLSRNLHDAYYFDINGEESIGGAAAALPARITVNGKTITDGLIEQYLTKCLQHEKKTGPKLFAEDIDIDGVENGQKRSGTVWLRMLYFPMKGGRETLLDLLSNVKHRNATEKARCLVFWTGKELADDNFNLHDMEWLERSDGRSKHKLNDRVFGRFVILAFFSPEFTAKSNKNSLKADSEMRRKFLDEMKKKNQKGVTINQPRMKRFRHWLRECSQSDEEAYLDIHTTRTFLPDLNETRCEFIMLCGQRVESGTKVELKASAARKVCGTVSMVYYEGSLPRGHTRWPTLLVRVKHCWSEQTDIEKHYPTTMITHVQTGATRGKDTFWKNNTMRCKKFQPARIKIISASKYLVSPNEASITFALVNAHDKCPSGSDAAKCYLPTVKEYSITYCVRQEANNREHTAAAQPFSPSDGSFVNEFSLVPVLGAGDYTITLEATSRFDFIEIAPVSCKFTLAAGEPCKLNAVWEGQTNPAAMAHVSGDDNVPSIDLHVQDSKNNTVSGEFDVTITSTLFEDELKFIWSSNDTRFDGHSVEWNALPTGMQKWKDHVTVSVTPHGMSRTDTLEAILKMSLVPGKPADIDLKEGECIKDAEEGCPFPRPALIITDKWRNPVSPTKDLRLRVQVGEETIRRSKEADKQRPDGGEEHEEDDDHDAVFRIPDGCLPQDAVLPLVPPAPRATVDKCVLTLVDHTNVDLDISYNVLPPKTPRFMHLVAAAGWEQDPSIEIDHGTCCITIDAAMQQSPGLFTVSLLDYKQEPNYLLGESEHLGSYTVKKAQKKVMFAMEDNRHDLSFFPHEVPLGKHSIALNFDALKIVYKVILNVGAGQPARVEAVNTLLSITCGEPFASPFEVQDAAGNTCEDTVLARVSMTFPSPHMSRAGGGDGYAGDVKLVYTGTPVPNLSIAPSFKYNEAALQCDPIVCAAVAGPPQDLIVDGMDEKHPPVMVMAAALPKLNWRLVDKHGFTVDIPCTCEVKFVYNTRAIQKFAETSSPHGEGKVEGLLVPTKEGDMYLSISVKSHKKKKIEVKLWFKTKAVNRIESFKVTQTDKLLKGRAGAVLPDLVIGYKTTEEAPLSNIDLSEMNLNISERDKRGDQTQTLAPYTASSHDAVKKQFTFSGVHVPTKWGTYQLAFTYKRCKAVSTLKVSPGFVSKVVLTSAPGHVLEGKRVCKTNTERKVFQFDVVDQWDNHTQPKDSKHCDGYTYTVQLSRDAHTWRDMKRNHTFEAESDEESQEQRFRIEVKEETKGNITHSNELKTYFTTKAEIDDSEKKLEQLELCLKKTIAAEEKMKKAYNSAKVEVTDAEAELEEEKDLLAQREDLQQRHDGQGRGVAPRFEPQLLDTIKEARRNNRDVFLPIETGSVSSKKIGQAIVHLVGHGVVQPYFKRGEDMKACKKDKSFHRAHPTCYALDDPYFTTVRLKRKHSIAGELGCLDFASNLIQLHSDDPDLLLMWRSILGNCIIFEDGARIGEFREKFRDLTGSPMIDLDGKVHYGPRAAFKGAWRPRNGDNLAVQDNALRDNKKGLQNLGCRGTEESVRDARTRLEEKKRALAELPDPEESSLSDEITKLMEKIAKTKNELAETKPRKRKHSLSSGGPASKRPRNK